MTLPAWVRKRDGTLVPFDPDAISSALFAACESLGQPDAFLARELADGVVHFLSADSWDKPLRTEQIEEYVVKSVRELGHPALAEAFAELSLKHASPVLDDRTPSRTLALPHLSIPISAEWSRIGLTRACMGAFSLQHIYSRDIAAAHRDGLVTLSGLESPFGLAGCVLSHSTDLLEAVERARQLAGIFVAIDGPEYALLHRSHDLPRYVRDLCLALVMAELRGVVNLNSGAAPSWATGTAVGPLFSGPGHSQRATALSDLALELLNALLSQLSSTARIDIEWHLADLDFVSAREDALRKVVRQAVKGAPIAFVFDRPNRPVLLAPGVDRQNPALLLTVGLNLPALATPVVSQLDAPARFLQKLGSAIRLALSAGVQKRDFLRKHGANKEYQASGFLLDRARLIVAPMGLHSVITSLLGYSLTDSSEGLEFGRRVVERMFDVMDEDSRTRHLPVGLDGSMLTSLADDPSSSQAQFDLKEQSRVVAALHAASELETATLHIPEFTSSTADELVQGLEWLWKRSNVRRLQLARPSGSPAQLTFSL